jgi:ppGpp synthetase/RelA/SpoT-type nucleotidyltranferase
MLTEDNVDEIVRRYSEGREQHVQFAEALVDLLQMLLNTEDVEFLSVTGRAKDAASFREKVTREGKSYADPLNEITDLCGVRVVCYDSASLKKIGDVIRDNFTLDDQNSVDKALGLEPDRFGYLSVHYVVSLDARRCALPEYRRFASVKAEIQVRTALQHAWATLDHSLRYKSKDEVPKELRRRLYRISALLELADDEFHRLKEAATTVRAEYASAIEAGDLDSVEVDGDSIEAFLKRNVGRIGALAEMAEHAGFAIAPQPPNKKAPPWTNLVRTLHAASVRTLSEFDELLGQFVARDAKKFKALATRWSNETASPRLVLDTSTLLRVATVLSLPSEKARAALVAIRFGPSLQAVLEHELEPPHLPVDAPADARARPRPSPGRIARGPLGRRRPRGCSRASG